MTLITSSMENAPKVKPQPKPVDQEQAELRRNLMSPQSEDEIPKAAPLDEYIPSLDQMRIQFTDRIRDNLERDGIINERQKEIWQKAEDDVYYGIRSAVYWLKDKVDNAARGLFNLAKKALKVDEG